MRYAQPEPDWFERERNIFIDEYVAEHPEASDFEAALMWELTTEPRETPKDYPYANV